MAADASELLGRLLDSAHGVEWVDDVSLLLVEAIRNKDAETLGQFVLHAAGAQERHLGFMGDGALIALTAVARWGSAMSNNPE